MVYQGTGLTIVDIEACIGSVIGLDAKEELSNAFVVIEPNSIGLGEF